METRRKKSKGMLSIGVLIILAGVLLVLLNIGILPAGLKLIIFSWPMFLIGIGVVQLYVNRSYIPGVILLLIGTFFLTPRLIKTFPEFFNGLNPDFVQNFWPLLLIILGLIIVFSAFKKSHTGDWSHSKSTNGHSRNKQNIGSSFEKNAVFSAGEYIVLEPVFTGGELNAVFGGIELDLRKTSLAEGDTFLEINAVFGGVSIIVPEDWYVETSLTCVLGGFSDERKSNEQYAPGRRLIITGACVFGGGELKC